MKFLFFLPITLFSLYMNNPASPEMTEIGLLSKESGVAFEVGYEGSFTFRRPMKIENRREEEKAQLSHLSYDTQFGSITLNLFDRVTLFSGLGSNQYSIRRKPLPETTLDYKSTNYFGFTVGGSATLFFVDDFSCGVSANYYTTSPTLKSIEQNGIPLQLTGSRLHYSEWQVGLGVSYLYKFLVPYVGVAFSSARLRITNPIDLSQLLYPHRNEDFKSDDTASLIIGLGTTHETCWEGNIEGRFIGETALSISATIRL